MSDYLQGYLLGLVNGGMLVYAISLCMRRPR